MIFSEIRLLNFRQYYGENVLKFPDPAKDGKNISILIADNGVGKSTLLQAFRYCFYGTLPNLLKLPKPEDLLSHYAISNAKELDSIDLLVEVKFKHNNKNYIVVRKEEFQKKNGKAERLTKEFMLSESTDSNGYKNIKTEDAVTKLWTMLPPEISQLFMFDGEHAEKKIEELDTRDFIKQSIIGLFNIKRADTLIGILSRDSYNVINYIQKRYPDLSVEAQRKIDEAENIKRYIAKTKEEIEDINKKIIILKRERSALSNYQQTYVDLKRQADERDQKQKEIYEKEAEIDDLSKLLIELSQKALKFKLLNEIKNRYREFISVNAGDPRHYQLLHVETLKDIIEKGICVCGRPIEQHSNEKKHILDLFQNALPQDYSHYFTLIDEEFLNAEDFSDIYQKAKEVSEKINITKYVVSNLQQNIQDLNQEISSVERQIGVNSQEVYDAKELEIEELVSKRSEKNILVESKETILKKLEIETNAAVQGNVQREKYAAIIEDLQKIIVILNKQKQEIDNSSRKILVEKFNENFNKISTSTYEASIDENYLLKITNTITNKDETELLSTGQTVAITLTFLKSLIDTAREITKSEDLNQEHGVILDAALSNIDEAYTAQISKNYFKSFDQMIFMSMKKSLRVELYNGIKENISIAYKLTKDQLNRITIQEVPLDNLYDYIHQPVGE